MIPRRHDKVTLDPSKPVDKKYLFAGKTFYLDLRNVIALRPQLEFGIKALHGVSFSQSFYMSY
jgi:hypothetical protein